MKNKVLSKWIAGIIFFASVIFVATAQKGQMSDLAKYFPAGALVYIETLNWKDLLIRWNQSETKAAWYRSQNYEAFTRSGLYQRLQERLEEFGASANFPVDTQKLENLAGTHSALALYDIGKLKALLITEVPEREATASEIWAARSSFLEKNWNQQLYYKEPGDGKLVFTYWNPYLIVATEETLLQTTLDTMKGKSPSVPLLIETEKWKRCMGIQPPRHHLWMFLDQEKLNQNRYFRKYWIHQNVESLKPILAAWIDLEFNPGRIREYRKFILAESISTPPSTELEKYLTPFQSLKHEFLSFLPQPSPDRVAKEIAELIHRYPEAYRKTSYPPSYTATWVKSAQAEQKNVYLTHIDEPIPASVSEKPIAADQPEQLGRLLSDGKPLALLQLTYPLWDDKALFVQFPETIVAQFSQFDRIDRKKFLETLRTYWLLLYSNFGEGPSWRQDGSDYILDEIPSLYVRFQQPWLVVSNRLAEFRSAVQGLPSAPVVPTVAYLSINWENGRWKYSRLMRRLDTGYRYEEPLFFSENIDSLLQSLAAVKKSSIQKSPDGEIVTYEIL